MDFLKTLDRNENIQLFANETDVLLNNIIWTNYKFSYYSLSPIISVFLSVDFNLNLPLLVVQT